MLGTLATDTTGLLLVRVPVDIGAIEGRDDVGWLDVTKGAVDVITEADVVVIVVELPVENTVT